MSKYGKDKREVRFDADGLAAPLSVEIGGLGNTRGQGLVNTGGLMLGSGRVVSRAGVEGGITHTLGPRRDWF